MTHIQSHAPQASSLAEEPSVGDLSGARNLIDGIVACTGEIELKGLIGGRSALMERALRTAT